MGRAVIAAHEGDADPVGAIEQAVGWVRFLQAVAEAVDLAGPETVDVRAELVRRWPTMRQFASALLDAFEFEGAPSASSLLRAVALLRDGNSAGKRALPRAAPIASLRQGWCPFVLDADGKPDRRAWEVCVLSELRDRMRADDVWIHGSLRYRNFEDCLLPKLTFAALRAEGPLSVGIGEDAAEYRRPACLLGRRDGRHRRTPKPTRCMTRRLMSVC